MMTLADQMYHKRIELNRTLKDMKSVSPKVSLYKKLEKKAEILQIELSNMGALRTKKHDKI